jgi:DNA helicase-2/ATP-dependent DNA helicase PcrA
MSTPTKFDESYAKLNPAQKKAVDTIDGPVMVVAGPGSGKTEILSLRVANILRKTDMSPGNILCLTFTDSAAVNMRKRLVKMIGNAAYRVAIHTFHGFGVETINSYPEYFFGGASLLPADDLATISILEKIFSELSYDNPLSSVFDGSFVYIRDAKSAISHLKKGGLTPDDFRAVLSANGEFYKKMNKPLTDAFAERLSKKCLGGIAELIKKLQAFSLKNAPEDAHSLHELAAASLGRALRSAEEMEKTTPISEWKKAWVEKDDEGNNVFKGTSTLPKLFALADVYGAYQRVMQKEGYYDFEDMILDVMQALKKNPALRFELQERYQYILVDEFQDTNDAQMRLIRLLTDAPVHEGRPNIMVVGDDDQAIYKFQGAEISNILSFREMFRDPVLITMTENYRSTQKVLDLARHVILKGEERLENKIPEMVKELRAGNKSLEGGSIVRKSFSTRVHEFEYVAKEIRRLTETGVKPSDIAVITRKHKELEALVPVLYGRTIPISYERRQNVFEEPHIRELIILARFVVSLARKDRDEADNFLPEILSFPFWRLPRKTIWEISREAERSRFKRQKWIDVMLEHSDPKVKSIAEFFVDVAIRSGSDTLEEILDELIGSEIVSVVFTEDDERDESKVATSDGTEINKFVSPFKEYYFSRDKFERNKAEFLIFLSSLRVFVGALREYKQGFLLRLDDLVDFVDLHEKNKIQVADTSPFVSGSDSVTLLSAHKAKGMEFDYVFALSCQNEIWAGRGIHSNLPFPKNLALAPAGDTRDDQLRLFYVALTRAKRHLYITSYETKEDGKESLPLEFIVMGEDDKPYFSETKDDEEEAVLSDETLLEKEWKALLAPPYIADETALLRTLLEEYQMSVTHLNNFLDVSRGGPQAFLEYNLLQFPKAKSPSGGYGTAVHGTIENIYTFLKREGKFPDEEVILEWFEDVLASQRLSPRDERHFLKQGRDAIRGYLKERLADFDAMHRIETNFKNQGVVFGDARITGKIDKMIPKDDGTMKVADFKTGKSFDDWEGKNPAEKIKMYQYRRQLVFYKLLVENSRDYAKYRVEEGALEFVEPDKKGKIHELIADITREETERTKALIEAVYKKIMALDFPDISKYSKDMAGMMEFENDLLK